MTRSVLLCSSIGRKAATAIACVAAAAPIAASALPVIPGGAGYGIHTVAGRGGQVHRVTNLNASGAGSLKACVDASGPRVCVFEVSGTIKANADLIIRNPNITIAGQTAPSPGVMWRGGALWVAASDVLVQHMRFRAGDDSDGPAMGNRDALKVGVKANPSRNVVIDHCSFSWAVDEVASVYSGYDDVTLSNNIFSEGLRDSHLPSGQPGGYGLIIGEWNGKVAIIGNLFAHNRDRNPLTRATQAVIVNNVVYNRAHTDVDLQTKEGVRTSTAVIGNVFIRGADYARSTKPVHIRTSGIQALSNDARVYVADNASLEQSPDDEWSVVGASSGSVPTNMKSALPPTWPAGLTRLSTNSNTVLKEVLRYAGARPNDRDPVDSRVVKSVRDRTGRIINCVSADGSARCQRNAGGWPTLAQHRRALTLPSNPSAVTSSGYTKLEVWLHEMSAKVEGRPNTPPSAPMLSSQN
jgi:pectate lyase